MFFIFKKLFLTSENKKKLKNITIKQKINLIFFKIILKLKNKQI